MKLLKLALKRETAVPILALLFATGVTVALIAARIVWTGKLRYGFLLWNLFLAWLPLVFALLALEKYRHTSVRDWRFLSLTGAWMLFFPNAPYIFTDLIHVTTRYFSHFWVDLVLILICALTGLVLGFVSLYLMQTVVCRIAGRLASWGFIAMVAALSSFGIYLGRFLRFNSWDVVVQPVKVYQGIESLAADPAGTFSTFGFPAVFAVFLFIAYVMLYGLTRLQPVPAETV